MEGDSDFPDQQVVCGWCQGCLLYTSMVAADLSRKYDVGDRMAAIGLNSADYIACLLYTSTAWLFFYVPAGELSCCLETDRRIFSYVQNRR